MFLSLGERIAVMRKITVLLLLAVAFAWASSAHAALVFHADFAQDTAYENSWPMKTDEVITVDVYVPNVPAPGLISMGFKLTYDSEKLLVESAGVDQGNWPYPFEGGFVDLATSGEIQMAGFRLKGLAGNNIRLGTVRFRCISEGTSAFMLLDRQGDWFVLDSEQQTVLDGDIGAGVLLATIRPPVPGNINGDGTVDLADAILALQFLAKTNQSYVHGNADVNADGLIGMAEAIYILQKVSGLRQ